MLQVASITKAFAGFVAVKNVSLEVERGEIHAVIGPNGAGKSTLFNLITGHLPIDSGTVHFEGERIDGLPPHAIVRRGIGRSFQRINVFPRLTVIDNVQTAVVAEAGHEMTFWRLLGNGGLDKSQALLETVGLSEDADRIAGQLSYGKQKQLELALALAAEPRILLLDEPTAGMSPAETEASIALVARIVERSGMTLLFTEHDMTVVFGIAHRISVLHHGEILATGTPAEIRADPKVQEVYLGRSAA